MQKLNANLNSGRLTSVEEATALIRKGAYLSVAGDEAQLRKLPAGHWIGGTIPYFMSQDGCKSSRDQVFVTELPVWDAKPVIRFYNRSNIHRLCVDAPENGFSILIIPFLSDLHTEYACNAPSYEDMFVKPVAGWICGVHLDELETMSPYAVNGETLEFSKNQAVVIQMPLPAQYYARVDIVTMFAAQSGNVIRFPKGTRGFSVNECTVNGQPDRIGHYLTRHKVDTKLPLVADYNGAIINADIRSVNAETGEVVFYAPVFENVPYHLSLAVNDFARELVAKLPTDANPVFVCNCVSNYADLEGKKVPTMLGPMTYGEIAYQLVNRTLVYLTLESIPA